MVYFFLCFPESNMKMSLNIAYHKIFSTVYVQIMSKQAFWYRKRNHTWFRANTNAIMIWVRHEKIEETRKIILGCAKDNLFLKEKINGDLYSIIALIKRLLYSQSAIFILYFFIDNNFAYATELRVLDNNTFLSSSRTTLTWWTLTQFSFCQWLRLITA